MSAPRPLPRTSIPKDRAAIAAGYRHLADLIESEQAPIPVGPSVTFFLDDNDRSAQAEAGRSLARAIGGGTWAKDTDSGGGYLILRGMCGGLPVDLWLTREAVCERVVVRTETVEIPAKPAVEAHTMEKEVVEWRCSPLLGAASETEDAVEVPA